MPIPYMKRSVAIAAEPQDVYDFAVCDLQSLSDWLTSVEGVESADETWPAVGTAYVYTRTAGGRTVRGRSVVAEADPPRRVVFREEVANVRGEGWSERTGRSLWTFEPDGSGTLATMELEGADLSLPIYVVWKLLFGRRVVSSLDRTLANLKRICEEELEDASGTEA